MNEKRVLRVVKTSTDEVVKEFDVSDKTERQIEKLEAGLLINLNHDEFYISDSKHDR